MTAPETRRRGGFDVTSVFTVYMVFLFAIPATSVVEALGSVGHPATILSLVALVWYAWWQVNRTRHLEGGRSPVRTTMLVFVCVMLLVYGHAMTQFLPPDEITNADSSLIRIIGISGIVLVLSDGLRDADRLRVLTRRLSIAAGLLSVLAIAQFMTGLPLVDRILIPGLEPPLADGAIGSRGQFFRPAGTATNAIELGAVLAMTLPMALTIAHTSVRHRVLAWLPPVLIGIAALFSLSRTTIICSAVAVAFLFPGWSRRTRLAMTALAPVGLLAAGAAVPGLLGTLRNMFLGAGEDTSIHSRTAAYQVAWSYIERRPVLGMGYNTFLPQYWILDNAYLQFLIGCGVVGTASFLALLAAAAWSAHRAIGLMVTESDRQLARAMLAACAAGAVSLFFFDGLSFPQSAGMLTMVLGLCGAVLRIGRVQAAHQPVRDALGP